MDYPEIRHFIDGEWTRGTGTRSRPVINPADDSVLAQLPEASPADLDRVLAAAQKAFEQWRNVAPLKRAEIILKGAQNLRERADAITRLASMEEGQPFEEGKTYVARAAEVLDWDANEGRRIYGRIIPSESNLRVMATREPIGVVAAFTPWNAPVFTPCRKIGSALGEEFLMGAAFAR